MIHSTTHRDESQLPTIQFHKINNFEKIKTVKLDIRINFTRYLIKLNNSIQKISFKFFFSFSLSQFFILLMYLLHYHNNFDIQTGINIHLQYQFCNKYKLV